MGGTEKKVMLGAGVGLALSSPLLDNPAQPRWSYGGPTFLAGKGLSIDAWRSGSDYGLFGIYGSVMGYYTLQLADDWQGSQDRALGLTTAFLLNNGATRWTKKLVARERPDRSNNLSFFSGHASASAMFTSYLSTDLILTYGKDYPEWVGLAVAANASAAVFVATARVGGNKHYTSDVLTGLAVGSGIGILTAKVFIDPENDAGNRPDPQLGLLGASVGLGGGLLAQWFRQKYFPKNESTVALSPGGPAGSQGLTLSGTF